MRIDTRPLRVIKRYGNRKLYDTTAKSYVSLDDLQLIIKQGDRLQVIDQTNGEDITSSTLTQIILEQGKKGDSALSNDVLHDMIRWGNKVVDQSIEHVRKSVDQLVQDSFQRLFPSGKKTEVEVLKERINQLEGIINNLIELVQQNEEIESK